MSFEAFRFWSASKVSILNFCAVLINIEESFQLFVVMLFIVMYLSSTSIDLFSWLNGKDIPTETIMKKE